MVRESFLPVGDYVSPGFSMILPDSNFPNLIIGDKKYSTWRYSRTEIPHNRYVDKRFPGVGFNNRDEVHILYNTALKFKGKKALEIGCWLGWYACHLALGGVILDVIDPLLENDDFYRSVSNSLKAANVLDRVSLIPGYSPQKVADLARELNYKWSLIFIDGNHEAPGPLNDAIACEKLAANDALILFHDLASPDVFEGLNYLKQKGWKVMIYQTAQIMGVAWRGNVEPVVHLPDHKIKWPPLPNHLKGYFVSGLTEYKFPDNLPLIFDLSTRKNLSDKMSLNDYGSQIIQLVNSNPGQLSMEEYSYITDVLINRKSSNFLVFGVGKDSKFWMEVNKDGETIFLEDNRDWLSQVKADCPEINVYLVEYNTTRKQWLDLLDKYRQGVDNLLMVLPSKITDTKWDVIFVDAPAGYSDEVSWKMKSIYLAAKLALNSGSTDVFVHDCDREVEKVYSSYFLKDENLVTQVKKLNHYQIIDASLKMKDKKIKEVSLSKQETNGIRLEKDIDLSLQEDSSKGIRILHIIQKLSRGGAARSMIATAKYSSRMGIAQEHRVIHLSTPEREAILLAKNEGMYVIARPDQAIICKEIEAADIVHIHFWNNPEIYELLCSELPAMRLVLWFKVIGDKAPHIITKELLEYTDFAIVTSPYTLELPVFENLSSEKKNSSIDVVYGIADFDRLRDFQAQPHDRFNVGYIGTVDFAKMHSNYVGMSAKVNIPNVKFIVCGGINNYLQREAEKLGVREFFDFRDYVEDIKSVLEILDVFGYPLCEDTYATSEKSLQEAMWVGVPPVVFPYGGVKKLVIHNQTGLVVNNEVEYKNAIEYLYFHPEERLRLGRNAREYARQNFHPEQATKKINKIYIQLLEKPKRKRGWSIKKISGAELFVQSLGNNAPHFSTSLSGKNIGEVFVGKSQNLGKTTPDFSTSETDKNISEVLAAENPTFGKNTPDFSTSETDKNISEVLAAENPTFGKTTLDFSTSETDKNISEVFAQENPTFGKTAPDFSTSRTGKNISEVFAQENPTLGKTGKNASELLGAESQSLGKTAPDFSTSRTGKNISEVFAQENPTLGKTGKNASELLGAESQSLGKTAPDFSTSRTGKNTSELLGAENPTLGKTDKNASELLGGESQSLGKTAPDFSTSRTGKNISEVFAQENPTLGKTGKNASELLGAENPSFGKTAPDFSTSRTGKNTSELLGAENPTLGKTDKNTSELLGAESQSLGKNTPDFSTSRTGKNISELLGGESQSFGKTAPDFSTSRTDKNISEVLGTESQSLGKTAPDFSMSETAKNISELLAAESQIADSSPVLCNKHGGGIFHYRDYYSQDGYLRLWSGLIHQKQGQHHQAISEFTAAINLGCNHWRVGFYLATSAEKINRLDLAEQILLQVRQKAPNFTPATDILQKVLNKKERSQLSWDKFQNFTYSKRSHFNIFRRFDFYKNIHPDAADLKFYQDTLVYNFITQNLPPGAKLLEIGGGNSRIIEALKSDYECWNIDKLEGQGNGPTQIKNSNGYRLVLDYIGNFNFQLPNNYFDCVFSISTLEHLPEDEQKFKNVCDDINRVLKPNGLSLHCIDIVIKKTFVWTKGILPYIFKNIQTLNQMVAFEKMQQDSDLYVMSEFAYQRHWQSITKQSYTEFGKPVSYNILWKKTEKLVSPNVIVKQPLPKISIVTPSLNQGEFLEECIDSILSQNYPNLEYIIMDGGSTDNSVEIIKKYEKYLTYWQSRSDGGHYSAINLGFNKTTGEIMGWLNSDDKYHPDAFLKVVAAFQKNQEIEWIMGRPTQWNKNGKLEYISQNLPPWSRAGLLNKDWEKYHQWIQQESTFWQRSLWEKIGSKLSTEFQFAGDFELWMRCSRYAQLFVIDTLIGGFRYYQNQRSQKFKNKYLEEVEKILVRELNLIGKGEFTNSQPAPKPVQITSAEIDLIKQQILKEVEKSSAEINLFKEQILKGVEKILVRELNLISQRQFSNSQLASQPLQITSAEINLFKEQILKEVEKILVRELNLISQRQFSNSQLASQPLQITSAEINLFKQEILKGVEKILVRELNLISQRQFTNSQLASQPLQITSAEINLFKEQILKGVEKILVRELNLISQRQFSNSQLAPQPVQITSAEIDLIKQEIQVPVQNNLVIVTSIAPGNEKNQLSAIESWQKSGFTVVSLNNQAEVNQLESIYKDVTFYAVKRDGKATVGRPLVYVDDLLLYLKQYGTKICGIINSDIRLEAGENFLSFVSQQAENSVIFGSRVDIDSFELTGGEIYQRGFDIFFFDKVLLEEFPISQFCLGLPWWDLWIPSMAIKKGLNSKYLATPVVYHLKHQINYSNDFWQTMGIHFAEFFNIEMSQKFQQILLTNPRQLQLELTQFAHHTVRNIHQKTEKVYYQTQRQNRKKNIDNPDMNNSNFTEIIDKFPAITSLSVSSKRPFFSVMIPTYKKVKYLEQTLKSVLQQALSPEEMQIEVVNDCPDVKIQTEIEAIVRKVGGERVNFYRHFPQDIGQAPIFNICLQRAQGYWIHLLHDDDFVLSGFYEKLRQVIEKNTTVGAAFCRHSYIDENNNQKMVSPLEKETPGIIPNWLEKIVVMQRIQCASIVVKRSVYEELGGFCLEAKSAADWEMWKRIAAYYSVSYEPQTLACYRLHSTSETSRLIKFGGNISDTRKTIEISESYLPAEISKKLSDRAREHYAISATKTAQQMLSAGKAEVAIAQIQEALKCSQSSEVKEEIISLFITSDATSQIDVNQLLSEVSKYVQEYQKDNSKKSVLNKLRQVRQQIANYWIKLPTEKLESAYLGDMGRANQKLIGSNIKYEQISEIEKSFVEQIATYISQGLARQNSIQYLLAATLYYYPHQLSPKWFVEAPIPKWFVNDYIKFMIDVPNYFQEMGEADKYYRYTLDWINYLHQRIFSNSDSKIWQDMAWFVTQKSNFIPLYFNNENLKDIYIKRAEIMELGLQSRGFNLDYVFPERSANRNKIRLGVLSSHFIPQTETFSTLPFFEHLDKTKFEIILYAKSTSEYSLEKYCQSCAKRFIKLPDNLISQVETIRNDDLDILLIGTNVTAITNPITLLALHRLARIQVTSTSSCVTTGMRHINYYISGKLTEPSEEAQQQYQEKLITLEGAAHCFNYYATEPEKPVVKPSRESWGVNDKNIVFVSGANFYKIIPELRETWAKIIAAVPNSILVLYPFNPNWSNNYQASTLFVNDMRSIFNKYGIEKKRLIVIKTLPSRSDIKECLKLCDVYLDSYPFAGVNSLIEPLEIGIPIITKDGNSFRSLMGSALLRSLSIPDLIADSEAEYINLAIKLANNSKFRQQKQQEIQEKMQQNPSFLDSRSYSAKISKLFQELFQEWQNVHLPKTIESQDKNSLTSEFINRLVGSVNLYKIDPTDKSLIEELRQLRKQIADFWLDVPAKNLETIYQGKVRQAYLTLLTSGIQNEAQTEEEEKFIKELADTSIGLTNPKGINALLGGMLYFPPGKMLVRDAKNRLPQWLINDYKQVFESREVAQKLEKAFQTKSPHLSEDSIGRGLETKGLETKGLETKPLQVNVVLTENKADNLDSANQKFLNQLLGSVNLYYIDPSDESVVKELRQLRKQTADFWINLEPQKLENFYLGEMGKGYQALLNSQIQNESLIEGEQEFLQELATQLSQGIESPKAINYLLAAMLYCRPEQLQIEDMDKLPHWLLADYQKFAGNG